MEKNILASVISYKGGAFDSIYTKIIVSLVQKRRASIDIRSGGGGSYYIPGLATNSFFSVSFL